MLKIIDLKFQGRENSIAAFLLETIDGPVLLETGPHSTINQLKKGIEDHGYSFTDVKHVFLSHIHLDHAGAAWAFAEHGAKIYIHPKAERHLINPQKLMDSAKRIYQDQMDSLWGDMKPIPKENLVIVDHKQKIKVGKTKLKALHTPGHAVHHISWQIGEVLMAGDIAGVKIKEGIIVPPCPPPDINVEDWSKSIRLIKSFRFKELYLPHFGKISNPKPHLIELEGRIKNWANWIRPHWEQGKTVEEITPEFQAYVVKQLRDGGVDGEDLETYELSNPSWMSVAGLMRYWSKKIETNN